MAECKDAGYMFSLYCENSDCRFKSCHAQTNLTVAMKYWQSEHSYKLAIQNCENYIRDLRMLVSAVIQYASQAELCDSRE